MKNLFKSDFFRQYFFIFLLAILAYFPIFQHLSSIPIHGLDEARLAMNAYEMNKDGDWIVTHFQGQPDMWNTKPPFMIWCQVLSMKFFGVNELAVRLPSAFAAFLTCVILLLFSIRYLKQYWFGMISVLVLITSWGYIDIHVSRTGDYDALLVFFTTCLSISIFAYFETKCKKYLYSFFICLTLAVLTKGIAGMLFLPGIFLYALFQKQFIPLLKTKETYIGIGIFLFFTLGYYFLRESQNPGYLKAVWENELGGRYLTVNEGHVGPFRYYFDRLANEKLTTWFYLIPCGILMGLFSKNKKILKLTIFASIIALSFFLVISFGSTKLSWYAAPLYPLFALFVGIFAWFIFEFLKNIKLLNNIFVVNIIPVIFLFLFFITPYRAIFDKTYKSKEYLPDKISYQVSYFMKESLKGKKDLNNYYLVHEGYNTYLLFYINLLNDSGIKIALQSWENLQNDDKIIVDQEYIGNLIQEKYEYRIMEQYENVITYQILNKMNR